MCSATSISSGEGTYAIVLYNKNFKTLEIGKLGTFDFKSGYYVYVGSAFGPGGLKARVGRHLTVSKKERWHLDYFRSSADVLEVWYSQTDIKVECDWALKFLKMRGVEVPALGFGSSDCSCQSHLFYFKKMPLSRTFRRKIQLPFDTVSLPGKKYS